MKSIVIVGAGIAGLTAGIYAQQAGFSTTIYEQHSIAGGLCTGWDRKGYHIDGCIHWLTGTRPGTALNNAWRAVGALGDDITLHQHTSFGQYHYPEGTITLWQDLERTRRELLALSPQDSAEIDTFIAYIKGLAGMEVPALCPMDMMPFKQLLPFMAGMKDAGQVMSATNRYTCTQYGLRFKHPAIQKMFADCMPQGYSVSAFLFSLAAFCGGNAAVPMGGSRALAQRMQQKHLALGGTLHLGTGVQQICVQRGVATGVLLQNGEVCSADYVISACDANLLFKNLLQDKYTPKAYTQRYANPTVNPVSSSVLCSFAAAADVSSLPSSLNFAPHPYRCGNHTVQYLGVKTYAYDPSFAPQNNCVIEVNTMLSGQDFAYWQNLCKDKPAYTAEKQRLAAEIQQKLEEALPQLKGTLTLLDVATPVTFYRYTGAYQGAWMSFIGTPKAKRLHHKGPVKGVKNLYFAGQWTQTSGGLPIALTSGKFAVQYICKKEKLNYLFA